MIIKILSKFRIKFRSNQEEKLRTLKQIKREVKLEFNNYLIHFQRNEMFQVNPLIIEKVTKARNTVLIN